MLCKQCRVSQNPPIFHIRDLKTFIEYLDVISNYDTIKALSSHDKNGYSYVHFIMWSYVSLKPKYKDPELAEEYLKIIYHLVENFPLDFLEELYSEGIPDDEKMTPMHYFANANKYFTTSDYRLLDTFRERGLGRLMEQEDGSGMTVDNYIAIKQLDPEIKRSIYHTQTEMKACEKILIDVFTEFFRDRFRCCEECGRFLKLLSDIDNLPQEEVRKILTPRVIKLIEEVIKKRRVINIIYRNKIHQDISNENHKFCIKMWSKKLE